MTLSADLIAETVLKQFDKLPSKRKPAVRNNGSHEWVPLAGIVAERNGEAPICLALATGMKCLPAAKIPESNGVGIHDWHAEVLVLRTLNRWLLDECLRVLTEDAESSILERAAGSRCRADETSARPFRIREDVKLHMYCSEAPCGDASMELTMAAQEDDSPWNVPEPTEGPAVLTGQDDGTLPGRAYFSQLGIVRRKPARGDAPPTLSKSCSDKLALRQCTSLLSSLAAVFIEPANVYIDTVVLPQSQFSAPAFDRAFSARGRLKSLVGRKWGEGYEFRPFAIETTGMNFRFSRRSVKIMSPKVSASNLATAWAAGVEETLVSGVLQGKKAFDVRGASEMSRRRMWTTAKQLASLLDQHSDIGRCIDVQTYTDVKGGVLSEVRRRVKADVCSVALKGWIKNDGDSTFSIDSTTRIA